MKSTEKKPAIANMVEMRNSWCPPANWVAFFQGKAERIPMRILVTVLFLMFLPACKILQTSKPQTRENALYRQFKNSWKLFERQRNEFGVYRDSTRLNGPDGHPCSVANVGMGLVSLCISDAMGWREDAADAALVTLKSMNGEHPSFKPARNQSGFFRHFIDMKTGQQAWRSEFSTIDTALLVSGALFCKEYFRREPEIAKQAGKLWKSIDWSKSIADPLKGTIYLELKDAGDGEGKGVTRPFNEYMIVAWLAMKAEVGRPGPASLLWKNHYADPDGLPQRKYGEYSLLTDNPRSFLSSFTIQFPFYLCHPCTTGKKYRRYFENAARADRSRFSGTAAPHAWGHGAGQAPEGYRAHNLKRNPNQVVSPHIVAGFIPALPEAMADLENLLKDKRAVYDTPAGQLLWRFSLKDETWRANIIQGIDYSCMLLGLAALPEHLGVGFFARNNNFSFPE
ncbi:MAG: hypothetical protein QGF00_08565 [Planctomycetota bacterium]|jgi:hypothetical protein|nr:hypothetical protein [Planctomycetota bacterium]MDP7249639.1 hypothetical protein [Planctomycetota bacterium]